MKLLFLGSGSAFVLGKENYHSNIVIQSQGKKLLYDCGTTIHEALDSQGLDALDIDSVFISHLHGDHSGGLEMMGFRTYFSTYPFGQKKLNILTSNTIREKLWTNQLSGSMSTIENVEHANFDTYFKGIDCITKNEQRKDFTFGDLKITPVSTIHSSKMESYGLYIKEHKVFVTGDTKFTPEHLGSYYEEAKIIFQDCEFKEYEGGYHAQYHQLKTLPEHIRNKMYLYHYILEAKTFEDLEAEIKREGFAGLVKRGFKIQL